MSTESVRIADQLRRAYAGDAWHGPSLSDTLSSVSVKQALARPLAAGHNIWELVLHIELWTKVALEAVQGVPMPKLYGTEKDWARIHEGSEADWMLATRQLQETAEQLAKAIESFDDARLTDIVPGRSYDFYYLFHGIVQHSLYHGGQIALLKRA